jgi:S-adenosylmethionine uptake transporter
MFRKILKPLAANPILAGIVLMLVGNFMFALNDAMGKWLVGSFSVGQVLLMRSVGAVAILGPMVARQDLSALIKVHRPTLHVLRVLLATADVTLFYAAVVHLPLADVMTFYMAGPIYVAAASHFFLGEKVGWRRWLAILVGFGGVLVALHPSSASLSWPSVFALTGSLSYSMTLVLNRTLRSTSDATLVSWQTIAAFLAGIVLSLGHWTTPSWVDVVAMLLLGIVSCSAHLMITRALKLAPASLLAPLQYSLLLWAILFGFAFFGDSPGQEILIGSAIIVFAGLFIFHRKAVVDQVSPEETVPLDGH